jgi:hypothetical protein
MIFDLFCNEVEFKNIQGYDDIKDIVRVCWMLKTTTTSYS